MRSTRLRARGTGLSSIGGTYKVPLHSENEELLLPTDPDLSGYPEGIIAPSTPRSDPEPPVRSPYYQTPMGRAFLGDSRQVLKTLPAGSVRLIVTSPPYALQRQKEYGNAAQEEYLQWFDEFVPPMKRVLADDGSLVINIGGAWEAGRPVRSTYHYRLLLRLIDSHGLHLAQDFFWFNPAKMPNPAQWVNIERCRVKDAVEPVWWLSKGERPFANNREVLAPYTKSMENLLKYGYNSGKRPSGWKVSQVWGRNNGGAIPPNFFALAEARLTRDDGVDWLANVLALPNTDSNSRYLRECRKRGISPHPARFPPGLPDFFIKFLSRPGETVLDPFAGSNLTGEMAEANGRRWIAIEQSEEYLSASALRFTHAMVVNPRPPKLHPYETCSW